MSKIIEYARNLAGKYPLVWQFIKFCSVGATNLALYMLVYWLLTRALSWHYLAASVGSFLVSVTWSFYFNLKWTFKHFKGDRRKQYLVFIAANLISMSVNLVLLTTLIEVFKIYDIYAQLSCSVIIAFLNFGLNRFWTFGHR